MDVIEKVKQLNLPKGKYVVCGSALLDVLGIRSAHDIDLIVAEGIYDRLKSEGWREFTFPGSGRHRSLFYDVYDAGTQWSVNEYKPQPTTLIKEANLINGVPFVRIEELLAWKRAAVRTKDKVDVRLIEQYLIGQN